MQREPKQTLSFLLFIGASNLLIIRVIYRRYLNDEALI
jgi:hypothetical protein